VPSKISFGIFSVSEMDYRRARPAIKAVQFRHYKIMKNKVEEPHLHIHIYNFFSSLMLPLRTVQVGLMMERQRLT